MLLSILAIASAGTHDAEILETLKTVQGADEAQLAAAAAILAASPRAGFGDPAISVHPMTPAQCQERRTQAGLTGPNPEWTAICGHPWMAPLYDPATGNAADATVCIDQFEFPDAPCSYPQIWTRASEADAICKAVGKRLCDAHEWEGACEGALHEPDYRWDLATGKPSESAVKAMRAAHNAAATHTWAYGGTAYQKGICAAASTKSAACDGSDEKKCGSNTYPTGAFPGCVSPLGVYDQHGNAAEHMNLPLSESQLESRGGAGVTEMKGSWFIFDTYVAHEDWCRWRAPFWHGGEVRDADSHRNYHLGFRCCRSTIQP